MSKQTSLAKDETTKGRNQEGRFLSSFGHGTLSAHLVSWFCAVFSFWFLSPLFVEACHKVFFKNQDDFSVEAINSSVQTLFTGMGFAAAVVALWHQNQTTKSAQAQREYDAFIGELPVIQLRFCRVSPGGKRFIVEVRALEGAVEGFQLLGDTVDGKKGLGWFVSPLLRPDCDDSWQGCRNFPVIELPVRIQYRFYLPASGVMTGTQIFRYGGTHVLFSNEEVANHFRDKLSKKYDIIF